MSSTSMLRVATRCWVLAILEARHFSRQRVALAGAYVLPLVPVVILAWFLDPTMKEYYGPIFVPSICTAAVISTCLMSGGPYVIEMRQARAYDWLGLMGMGPGQMVNGLILSRWLIACTQLIVLLFASNAVFHLVPLDRMVPVLLAYTCVAALASYALFQMSVSLMLFVRRRETALTVARVATLVLIPLAGCFYNSALMPRWLYPIAIASPGYSVYALLRAPLEPVQHVVEYSVLLAVYAQLFTLINLAFFRYQAKLE